MLKTKITNIVLFLSLLGAITIAGLLSSVLAQSNRAKIDLLNPEGNVPLIVGSIIQTKNPGQVKNFAKSRALSVSRVHPTSRGNFLVAVDEPPFTPAVLELNRKVFSTKVTPNFSYQIALTPNDTNYPDQWSLPKISAPKAWDITTGASPTNIAIIDTGVLFSQSWGSQGPFTQPDFPTSRRWENPGETGALAVTGIDDDGNGFVDDQFGWDFMGGFSGDVDCPNHDPALAPGDYVEEDNDPQPYSCDSPSSPTSLNKDHYNGTCEAFVSACFVGHGTMVASVAAAETNNSQLVAGLDHQAKIMNLRVLDGYGFTTTDRVAAAVDYAGDNGADVINLSLAVTDCSNPDFVDTTLETALADAKAAGAVTAAASGNENLSNVCYPASSTHTIAVGATNQNDQRASFSNYGTKLDVVAPGVGIPVANAPSAAINSNYYPNANGTSLSTPHVAGVASLIKGSQPTATPDVVFSVIKTQISKVKAMNGANKTDQYGWGRVNAAHSVLFANLTHPDGTLVKKFDSPHVYRLDSNQRRSLSSQQVFASYFHNSAMVHNATPDDTALGTDTALDFREGTLVKGSDPTVYVIDYEGGTIRKRSLGSLQIFNDLGYSFSEVIKVNNNQLPADGPALTDASQHPDGTLIKANGDTTVYLLEESQRRSLTSLDVFNSYNYSFSRVKTSTNADSSLPIGNALDFREGTLVKGSDPTIYVIDYESGTIRKRSLTSLSIFRSLGYVFSDVIKVDDSQLPADGPAVTP